MVKYRSKYRTIKVIRRQIFTIHNNIAHHLIGNTYYSLVRNVPIEIHKEKAICKIKPIILTKFTFRHTPKRNKYNKHMSNLKDY